MSDAPTVIPGPCYSRWMTAGIFALAAAFAGGTVAGPGLSWDEPAYRHSQITLECWLRELRNAQTWGAVGELFSKVQLLHYWEYNRFGHNFHPPLGGMANLASYWAFGGWLDEISARRMASALEFAVTVAALGHFLGRRYGVFVGIFAALSLLFLPRAMGDAHVIGTDMPLLCLWSLTAIAFWNGLESRAWQFICAALFGCLFLVKFTGVVLLAPLMLWFAVFVLGRQPAMVIARWLAISIVLVAPCIPLGIALLTAATPASSRTPFGLPRMDASAWWLPWLFLWPSIFLVGHAKFQTRADRALELPWVIAAVAPLVAIALNPTWWHDTVPELAKYLDLNLRREGHLPDIGIFYLGRRYLYTLPWHNAFVLMAVTIPFGTLAIGLCGWVRAVRVIRRDPLPLFFLVNALALPFFRMLGTPAHDGVRLFLPTFFFWCGLAGMGAGWLVDWLAAWTARPRLAAALVLAIGPAWSAAEWVRIHPFELSYYNIGLRRAVRAGFEPTYWYDAVTPRVLKGINERLPGGAQIGFPDPLINPEVFAVLQELGRLRGDIRFDTSQVPTFPWYWLLTHSSKATAYTRLLYACEPWYESGHDGVRLFSVVDPKASGVAWALYALTVQGDPGGKLGEVVLFEPAFSASEGELRRAVALVDEARRSRLPLNSARIANEPDPVRRLLGRYLVDGKPIPMLELVLARDPDAMNRAMTILTERAPDVRSVLVKPGYQLPKDFHGYFPVR